MAEPDAARSRSDRKLALLAGGLVVGLCLCAGICAAALALASPGSLLGRQRTQSIASPDGTKVLVTSVNTSRADPKRYLTVQFEIRDAATQAVLFQQGTGASDRMRWSMRWLSDSEIQLRSSDIGDYCWRESPDGDWASAPCPP